MRRAALALGLALGLAGAAFAQDPDPIGDLLNAPDKAEPETAPAPVAEPAPAPAAAPAPTTAPAPAETVTTAAPAPEPEPALALQPAPQPPPAPPPGLAASANSNSDEEEAAAADLADARATAPPAEAPAPGAAPQPPAAPTPYQAAAAIAAPPASPPPPAAYAAPGPGRPTNINETGVAPDGPPSARDLVYENRVRATYNAAQGAQGPMDGRWTLTEQGSGATLFVFQLVDAPRTGALEGVWRDPSRPPGVNASGIVADVSRDGGHVTLTFSPTNSGSTVVLVLLPSADGSWSGEMQANGVSRAVVLRRN